MLSNRFTKLISTSVILISLTNSGCESRLKPGMCGYRDSEGEFIELMQGETQLDLPLYHEFIQARQKVVDQYPSLKDLNYLGTDFETSSVDWENGGYWCTPINSVAFGWTGGDGVHFSFLLSGNKVDEKSPVIMTIPANSSLPNIIVAENFAEFLLLGLNHGFFGLEQLSYEPEAALTAICDVNWTTEKAVGWEKLLCTSPEERVGLDFTRELLELGVSDLNKEKFDALQNKYLPQLILPDSE